MGGTSGPTLNAFGAENGKMVSATPAEVDSIIAHLQQLTPPTDCRFAVRAIEAELFETRAGELIANQAFDFRKLDGVTEIEESLQASGLGRRTPAQGDAASLPRQTPF